MKNKTFVIIDAMALAYKAYFAFINRPLTTSKGKPVSAVYGFVTQVLKIIEDLRPDYIAVASDSKEKTFRHDKFESYKANRAEIPDDLIPQINLINEFIGTLNIPLYIVDKYEADDIIGTAAKEAEKAGLNTIIVSPDKDLNQLITDKVKIIKPGKSADELQIIDSKKMLDDFGFTPKLMIDYLALVGDSSDNIPGVAGIGPKTAIPLIQKFGTIENIYKNIDQIDKKGIVKKLLENKQNAFLSKDLATVNCSVPLKFDFKAAKFTNPDFDKLKKIFLELEFKSLYERLAKIFQPDNKTSALENLFDKQLDTFDKTKSEYVTVNSLEQAKELAELLTEKSYFVFDTETDSLDTFNLNIAGASFCVEAGKAYFIPINPFPDKNSLFNKNEKSWLSIDEFKNIFSRLFSDNKIKKICQNGKFDIAVLRHYGITVNNFYFDTMLASYVLNPDQKHGMDDLAEKYLGYKPISYSELVGEKKNAVNIFETNLEQLSSYAAEDADITYRLYLNLKEKLSKENLEKIAYEIEFPLVPVLEDMEYEGIKIDRETLNSFSKDLQKMIDEYTEKIYKLAGKEFNINSPKQLQEILYDDLGLKTGKKTKTGFSTNASALENLKGEHEIIDLILDFRQVSKLKNTYADALPNLINPSTGRIHTSFNQTVASTGRLSSNNPNLQNIPIRTDLGKEIRRAFVPRDNDHILISADYSQIELRIMAAICGDETLKKAFKNREDIHRSTAALVFMVNPENVTDDMRRKAKEVNFGILYGIGPFGLKTRLGISQNHAKEIIETYFNTFKKVKNFMEDSVQKARETGYAETLLGRRRYLKNINNNNRVVRQFEERVAINMPIQGTAADMIKIAMVKIFNELKKRKSKTKMVLQVHDELVFDAHKDEVDDLVPVIKNLMENALPLDVPILTEIGIGENWLDAH